MDEKIIPEWQANIRYLYVLSGTTHVEQITLRQF